eukprot:scaffold103479_cov19-Prasinocladus_malaysianus.AAC.1
MKAVLNMTVAPEMPIAKPARMAQLPCQKASFRCSQSCPRNTAGGVQLELAESCQQIGHHGLLVSPGVGRCRAPNSVLR